MNYRTTQISVAQVTWFFCLWGIFPCVVLYVVMLNHTLVA